MMNKVTSSCIFCQLLKSNQDIYLLEQSQYGVAILDINPISDGHTLVISKTCFSSFIKASEKVISDLVIFSQKMINKLQLILKPKGWNLITNINQIAAQTIYHLHFHLIPKYEEKKGFVFQEMNSLENKLKNKKDLPIIFNMITKNFQ